MMLIENDHYHKISAPAPVEDRQTDRLVVVTLALLSTADSPGEAAWAGPSAQVLMGKLSHFVL